MGYYTNYTLTTDSYVDLKYLLDAETGYDWEYFRSENKYFLDGVKWYSNHEDMIKISKKCPSCLFTLHGEGEESGDLWYTYYKNGEFQEAKAVITYETCKL
jgi:hypothetical protein